jgi:glutamyl-tRNA reductase
MSLLLFGVSHKTAPLEVRERIVIDPERLGPALVGLRARAGVNETLILSTCNRTEVYCGMESPDSPRPTDWLLALGNLNDDSLASYLYERQDEHVVRHLFRVAAGLDSMVVGEPQILGQLKDAYRAARDAGTIGHVLDKLLQFSFRVAKAVRTDTELGAAPVSVAYVAVGLAVQVHGELTDKTALLIGAGDTMTLAAMHLRERRIARMLIANRSLERAQALAERFEATAIPLTDIARALADVDIVVSATGSRVPIVTAAGVAQAMASRRHRPIFIVDLAVPRDVEPEVGAISDVYLYDVDNLNTVLDRNMAARRAAAGKADELVNLYTQEYMDRLQSLDAVGTIRQLRERADRHREEILQRALHRLEGGQDAKSVVAQATHTLMNRLLHDPTVQLRDPEIAGDAALVETIRRLYRLDHEDVVDKLSK